MSGALQRAYGGASRPTQRAAGYVGGGGRERCAECRFFMPASTCMRIQGPVSPRGWCRYYSRELSVLRYSPRGAGAGAALGAGATLDLGFTAPGQVLDPSLTFTRGSTATYFNSSGVMQTAGLNMLNYSANFAGAGWVLAATTITAGADIAPDGTMTMTRLAETATTAIHYVTYPSITTAASAYTVSVFVKASQVRYLQLSFDDSGANGGYATFDVQSGTVSQAIAARGAGVIGAATIQAVSGGIYRCAITVTIGASATGRFLIALSNTALPGAFPTYAGNTANGLSIWGAQVELGTVPTTYGPTTGAANGAPRFDYDPVTHAALGLLIEEQRQNLMLQSADMSNAAWTKAGVGTGTAPTVTANQIAAPDGMLTAARVVFPAVSGSGNASVVAQTFTGTAAAYSASVWLRGSVGGEQLYVMLYGANLPTLCTLTTSWQRFTVPGVTLTAAAWFLQIGTDRRETAQADKPTCTIYVWGAQVELGAFPTSYIPTTAAAVTRSADVCNCVNAGLFGGTTGRSIAIDGLAVQNTAGAGANATWLQVSDGSVNNYMTIWNPAATVNLRYATLVSAVTQFNTGDTTTGVRPTLFKAALSNGITWAGAMNGTIVPSSGGASILLGPLTTMGIGQGGATQPNGYIRRVRYWPRVLSNTELQAVTQLDMTPSLNLDFMSGVLDPLLTLTRGTIGTYFDVGGVMRTASGNAPRFDYDVVTHQPNGLLIEETRTNLVFPSVVGPGGWTVIGAATMGGSVVAPDGSVSTTSLVAASNTTNNIHLTGTNNNPPVAATTAYVVSMYMKAGPVNGCIQLSCGAAVGMAYFDLTNGTGVVGTDLGAGLTNKSVTIAPAPNGWYRVSYAFTTQVGATSVIIYVGPCITVSGTGDNRSYVGVVGQGVYVWGVQIEAGAFATSYIPTTSVAVTRNADVCSMPVGAWYTQQNGTLQVEALQPVLCNKATEAAGFYGSNGKTALTIQGSNNLAMFDDGSALNFGIGPQPVGTVYKVAYGFSNGAQRGALNGAVPVSASAATLTTGITSLSVGSNGITQQMGGYIRRVQYWPRVLNNTELQQVTT